MSQQFSNSISVGIKTCAYLNNACKVFDRTQESANHFFDVYDELGKGVSGAPSHKRQDLLRAMLVFSSAGIDIFLKQIIADSLSIVIQNDNDAHKMFTGFVEKRLKKGSIEEKMKNGESMNLKFIAGAISADDTRLFLLNEYKKTLTDNSLQSKDEVFRVAAAFAIESKEILKGINDEDLGKVFRARNSVIHELDIDFSKSKDSNTRKRKKKETIQQCSIMFCIMLNFLQELNIKLNDQK